MKAKQKNTWSKSRMEILEKGVKYIQRVTAPKQYNFGVATVQNTWKKVQHIKLFSRTLNV